MSDGVVAFAISSLGEMNFDVEGADGQSRLGPSGIDLDSLAVAELTLRIEDRYGVKFAEEELEKLAAMTLSELGEEVDRRGRATVAVEEGATP